MLCCGVRPVRKSFAMRSYKKYARKRPGMSRYEIIGLKVPWNEKLQERGGRRVALIVQPAGQRTAAGGCPGEGPVSLPKGETVTARLGGGVSGPGSASGF